MNNKNYKSKTSDFALIKQLKTFITSIHTCRPSRPSSNSSKQTKYFQYKKTNIHCYNKNNIDIMLLNLIFYYDLFKSTKIVKKKYQKKKTNKIGHPLYIIVRTYNVLENTKAFS